MKIRFFIIFPPIFSIYRNGSHSNSRNEAGSVEKRVTIRAQRLCTNSTSIRDFEGKIESAGRASAADIFESAPLTFLIRDTGRPVRHLV